LIAPQRLVRVSPDDDSPPAGLAANGQHATTETHAHLPPAWFRLFVREGRQVIDHSHLHRRPRGGYPVPDGRPRRLGAGECDHALHAHPKPSATPMIEFTTVTREFRSLVDRRRDLQTFLGSGFA